MGHHDNDEVWHKDEQRSADADEAADGQGAEQEGDGGQVSEGGSGAPNAEANRGGADSVPDTPDNNDPFDRPGRDFTEQSKGGGSSSTRG